MVRKCSSSYLSPPSQCILGVDPSDVFNSAFYFSYQSLSAIVK
ncbi:hypothetical protein MtrunA17_Chr7g0276391 [Medicago truncatula]|uniref:Uncharacterized protein n=1 Tax=Medicago truncatula TaxID=3880 RepID=A0A396HAD5_MEDTR|nr:hypothetical protein MtrunA17_Chr7g0276391 [Medicago truncatula]